jgi:hypothetical protein
MTLRFDPTPTPRTPAATVTLPVEEFTTLLRLAARFALGGSADECTVAAVLGAIATHGADLDAGERRELKELLVNRGPWFDREPVPEAEKRRWELAIGSLGG